MEIIGTILIVVDVFVFSSFFICLLLALVHIRFQIKKLHRVKKRIRALASAVSSNRHMSVMAAIKAASSAKPSSGLRAWKPPGKEDAAAKSTKVTPADNISGLSEEQKERVRKLEEIERKFGKDSEEYAAQQNLVLQHALFG